MVELPLTHRLLFQDCLFFSVVLHSAVSSVSILSSIFQQSGMFRFVLVFQWYLCSFHSHLFSWEYLTFLSEWVIIVWVHPSQLAMASDPWILLWSWGMEVSSICIRPLTWLCSLLFHKLLRGRRKVLPSCQKCPSVWWIPIRILTNAITGRHLPVIRAWLLNELALRKSSFH